MVYDDYSVIFNTTGYTPQLTGTGPWYVYGGPSPFKGYGPDDRPPGATQVCILVANPDHSIRPGTGNCYPLP